MRIHRQIPPSVVFFLREWWVTVVATPPRTFRRPQISEEDQVWGNTNFLHWEKFIIFWLQFKADTFQCHKTYTHYWWCVCSLYCTALVCVMFGNNEVYSCRLLPVMVLPLTFPSCWLKWKAWPTCRSNIPNQFNSSRWFSISIFQVNVVEFAWPYSWWLNLLLGIW